VLSSSVRSLGYVWDDTNSQASATGGEKPSLRGTKGKARQTRAVCFVCPVRFLLVVCSVQLDSPNCMQIAGAVRSRIMHRAATRRCRRGLGALRSAWCFAIHDKCPHEVAAIISPPCQSHPCDQTTRTMPNECGGGPTTWPIRRGSPQQRRVASPSPQALASTSDRLVTALPEHLSPAVMQSRSPFQRGQNIQARPRSRSGAGLGCDWPSPAVA